MSQQLLPDRYMEMKRDIEHATGKESCPHCDKPLPKVRVHITHKFSDEEEDEETDYCSKECAISDLQDAASWLEEFYQAGKRGFEKAIRTLKEMQS